MKNIVKNKIFISRPVKTCTMLTKTLNVSTNKHVFLAVPHSKAYTYLFNSIKRVF